MHTFFVILTMFLLVVIGVAYNLFQWVGQVIQEKSSNTKVAASKKLILIKVSCFLAIIKTALARRLTFLNVLILLLVSCSSPESNFEGEWIPVEETFGGAQITQKGSIVIKKENDKYLFYTKEVDGEENKMGEFSYRKERNVLTLDDMSEDISISHDKKSKHLIVKNYGNNESFELKRKK